jgi:hypothetical protein
MGMNEITDRYVASVMAPAVTPYQGWSPCMQWCEEHIVDGWWYIGEGVFEFVDEADHLMFALRWA